MLTELEISLLSTSLERAIKMSKPEIAQAIDIVSRVFLEDSVTSENFLRLRNHHPESAIHTHEVTIFLTAAAIKLGWNEEKVKFMAKCGLWHDIGKVDVREELLSAREISVEEKTEIQFTHLKKTGEIITQEIQDSDLKIRMLKVIMPHHSILPNGDGSVYFGCTDCTPSTPEEVEMALLLPIADKTARIMYGIHEDREPDPERVKIELAHYKELTDVHPNIGELVDTIYEVIS